MEASNDMLKVKTCRLTECNQMLSRKTAESGIKKSSAVKRNYSVVATVSSSYCIHYRPSMESIPPKERVKTQVPTLLTQTILQPFPARVMPAAVT